MRNLFASKRYGCGACGASFKDREDLCEHADRMHEKKTSYLCLTCDESFQSEPSFKLHMARDHKVI